MYLSYVQCSVRSSAFVRYRGTQCVASTRWLARFLISFSDFAILIINILATSLPPNDMTTGDLSDALPNLFVPSGITFSIWGLIWLLFAAYLFIQLHTAFNRRGGGPDAGGMVERDPYAPGVVGFWFPLNMALNARWIFAWHYQLVGLSVLIMLALLATLIVMFLNIDAGKPAPRRHCRLPRTFVRDLVDHPRNNVGKALHGVAVGHDLLGH